MTSRRIFSLRRVSRKWAQAVRSARSALAERRARPSRRNAANENWVERISDDEQRRGDHDVGAGAVEARR